MYVCVYYIFTSNHSTLCWTMEIHQTQFWLTLFILHGMVKKSCCLKFKALQFYPNIIFQYAATNAFWKRQNKWTNNLSTFFAKTSLPYLDHGKLPSISVALFFFFFCHNAHLLLYELSLRTRLKFISFFKHFLTVPAHHMTVKVVQIFILIATFVIPPIIPQVLMNPLSLCPEITGP